MTKKVSMTLPELSFERLNALKSVTTAESYAEVISNALRLYEALIKQAGAGSTFIIRHPDGSEEKCEVFS